VERWDVAFAGLYLDALEASLAGRPQLAATGFGVRLPVALSDRAIC
jgi:hypothetical protein